MLIMQWLLNTGVLTERKSQISEKLLNCEKRVSFWKGSSAALPWDYSPPFPVLRVGQVHSFTLVCIYLTHTYGLSTICQVLC